MKKLTILAVMVVLSLGLVPGVAEAKSDSTISSWTSSAKMQANSWSCTTFWDKCSWATSSKAFQSDGSTRRTVTWIQNDATLKVSGISASLTLTSKKEGSVTVDGTGKEQALRWKNNMTWIADLNGTADPNWAAWKFTACSKATGFSYSLGRQSPVLEVCTWA